MRRPRSRWRPASPSEDGGFEVVVEFCLPQGQLVFQVGNLLLSLRDLLRPLGQLPIAFSNLALQPTILALQPLALGFRALGALAPLGSRAAWLILVTSRGHTTVMADSDKKYKYKILDQHKRATPP